MGSSAAQSSFGPGRKPRLFSIIHSWIWPRIGLQAARRGLLFLRKLSQKEAMILTEYGYNPFGGGYGQPTQQMVQQAYNQQARSQMMGQQTHPRVITHMVTSREEATTAQIPFDNTINVFLNLGAGEVYVKRFDFNTGGAFFDDFLHPSKLQQMAQQQAKPAPEYATVEMVAALEAKVGELAEAMSAKRKRGVTPDE